MIRVQSFINQHKNVQKETSPMGHNEINERENLNESN